MQNVIYKILWTFRPQQQQQQQEDEEEKTQIAKCFAHKKFSLQKYCYRSLSGTDVIMFWGT